MVYAVKQKELEAASESFDRALQLAKGQEDRAAENAIRRAIDDINSTLAKRPKPPRTDSTPASQTSRGTLRHNDVIVIYVITVVTVKVSAAFQEFYMSYSYFVCL